MTAARSTNLLLSALHPTTSVQGRGATRADATTLSRGSLRSCWFVYCMTLLGCAGTRETSAAGPPRTAESSRLASARSLEQLDSALGTLEMQGEATLQHDLGRVLQQFGRAVEPLSHATDLQIQQLAQQLAGSPTGSLSQPGLLKEALTLIQKRLVSVQGPPKRRVEYVRALRALRESTRGLDDLVALQEQRPSMVAALHAAADVVFLARGGEAPFGQADRMEKSPAPVGSFETELRHAEDQISSLAQTNLTPARKTAAAALAALGDVVEAADDGQRLSRQVSEIRFQAERLQRAEATEFGQAGWIRSGLESALEAWAMLYARSSASPWVSSARRAVAGIDRETSLSFQRASIQDAFRTTAAAFAAESQSSFGCPEPAHAP